MQKVHARTLELRKDAAYKAGGKPSVIDIPEMLFVAVDGEGPPENNRMFEEAMQILYGVVYTIKFWDKKYAPPPDYAKFSLTPLEGLWWSEGREDFDPKNADAWRWRVMIRLPDFVDQKYFKQVVDDLKQRKQSDIYSKAKLIHFREGLCVQLMHVGPYDQEEENIKRLHSFAAEQGYVLVGKHHELYFSDPRRTAPERLKTIIRQPVYKAV